MTMALKNKNYQKDPRFMECPNRTKTWLCRPNI